MSARIGVVTFPGSLDDRDALRAITRAGAQAVSLWHADPDLHDVDAVVLPGGFSYGDYLRCGAIARFAPVMDSIIAAAGDGLPVLGICNGFQMLCEAHLLPGALVRNDHRKFVCRDQRLEVHTTNTRWTGALEAGRELVIPIKNGEGSFVADEPTLDRLQENDQIVLSYLGDSPNGSYRAIAGICNEARNVVGMMPHPEHAIDLLTGPSADGLAIFTSVLLALTTSSAA